MLYKSNALKFFDFLLSTSNDNELYDKVLYDAIVNDLVENELAFYGADTKIAYPIFSGIALRLQDSHLVNNSIFVSKSLRKVDYNLIDDIQQARSKKESFIEKYNNPLYNIENYITDSSDFQDCNCNFKYITDDESIINKDAQNMRDLYRYRTDSKIYYFIEYLNFLIYRYVVYLEDDKKLDLINSYIKIVTKLFIGFTNNNQNFEKEYLLYYFRKTIDELMYLGPLDNTDSV